MLTILTIHFLIFLVTIINLILYNKLKTGRIKYAIICSLIFSVPYVIIRFTSDLADQIFGYWLWGFIISPYLTLIIIPVVLVIHSAIKNRLRKLIYMTVMIFVAVYLNLSCIELLFKDYSELTGKINDKGFCKQSTSYSCGPAAVSMLLHRYNKNVSEKEIGEACKTSYFLGTNEFLVCAYLREKLDRPVEIYSGSFDRPSPPYLEVVKLSALVHHWVLVTDDKGKEYQISDPLVSQLNVAKDFQEQRTRNIFVKVID